MNTSTPNVVTGQLNTAGNTGLTYSVGGQGTKGTVTVSATGAFTYTRNDGEPLKDRTREHYESLLDSRIYPVLGDLPMHHITEDTLKAWRDQLPATPNVR